MKKLITKIKIDLVDNFDYGCNFLKSGGNELILYKFSDDSFHVFENVCKHKMGKFVKTKEDNVIKCIHHGWQLNAKSCKYTHPSDENLAQEKLIIEKNGDLYEIYKQLPIQPWEESPIQKKQDLAVGELSITYYSHACIKIKCGDKVIFTDPWLTGPAFLKGWWLLHEPPATWVDDVASADMVYISHSHSDHLNIPTLEVLLEKNPNLPITVADLSTPVVNENQLSVNNLNIVETNKWHNLDKDTRYIIFKDSMWTAIDTSIFIEYKGWTIFATVDCCMPNGGIFPTNIDVLLTDFAGGASGYPACHEGGKYKKEWIKRWVKADRAQIRKKIVEDYILPTKPRCYIPYAGYMIESHPDEYLIKELNVHNSPEQVADLVEKAGTPTWIPTPGAELDIKTLTQINSVKGVPIHKECWDFEKHTNKFIEYRNFEPLQNIKGFQYYFDWVGFRDYDMILHIQEVGNINDSNIINEFYVDFCDLNVTKAKPLKTRKYFKRLKVPIDLFRYVLANALPWSDLYIGFQFRSFREPDYYHIKFWQHFSSNLPLKKPQWKDMEKNLQGHFPRGER